jgi:hypothetical protein
MCILAFAQRLTLPPSLLGNPDHLTAPVPEAQRRRIESDREAKNPLLHPKISNQRNAVPLFPYISVFQRLVTI